MLTSRGCWFLLAIAVLLSLGVLGQQETLGLVAMTLLVWFAGTWLVFVHRARVVCRRLRVQRRIEDEHGPVATLWAGRTARIHTELQLKSAVGIPYLIATDRIPFGTELLSGEHEREGTLDGIEPLRLEYELKCHTPGRVRFEGVGVRLADLCGFFYYAAFVPAVEVVRVLPPLVDAEGNASSVKRHNLLPPPGVHRFHRPGSGSELLDLRDYMPGDPPKTIAWKISARRDRLITKEFESEVPIRCTLFVDTSNSVRVGPAGDNALTALVRIGASVAQAAIASRDLLGLCLFDQEGVQYIRPARGARHLVQLLSALTDVASLPPTTGKAEVQALLPLASGLAQEVYPHLLARGVNATPAWVAAFWPAPTYPRERRARVGLGRRAVFWTLGLVVLLVLAYAIDRNVLPVFLLPWLTIVGIIAGVTVLAAVLGWAIAAATGAAWGLATLSRFMELAAGFWRGLRQFLSHRRQRESRHRKQLAALLSVRYGLAPGGLSMLMEDDERFSVLVQRFLADHHVPYPLPFYDSRGRYLFAVPEKVDVLARALLLAVGRGHDNELFVLLADLLELTDRLDPLLRAVKIALARHHRVVVICPWPPGIPVPSAGRKEPTDKPAASDGKMPIKQRLQRLTIRRFERAFHRLRRTFGRFGVPVVCAGQGDPARLILERLERLRGVGGKR